jgi:hypothetical protein
MTELSFEIAALVGVIAATIIGLSMVRSAWTRRGKAPKRALAGWFFSGAGVFAAGYVWGEPGLISALAAFSVAAYIVVAAGAERRNSRSAVERDVTAEPEERPTNWRRAVAKSLLAIVLAGVASVGLGLAFAVAAPLEQVDRIVIGGLLVPMLWGAGMAWTLCDAKLLRATALLLLISACAYAVAFLPKILST